MTQKVSELMTSAPVTLSSGQTVADAARTRREADISAGAPARDRNR